MVIGEGDRGLEMSDGLGFVGFPTMKPDTQPDHIGFGWIRLTANRQVSLNLQNTCQVGLVQVGEGRLLLFGCL